MILQPELSYPYAALEPVLSEAAMRLHHLKHHAAYVAVVNGLTIDDGNPPATLEQIIRHAALSGERRLFNNAAQAWNHAFFWLSMAPRPSPLRGSLAQAIDAQFGGLDGLRTAFIDAGVGHFGSGWVWLAAEDDRLSVFATHDADTVVTRDLRPLLVCDLWEHAYYLDHHNDRSGFLNSWWDRLANWAFAQEQFSAGRGGAWRHPPPLDARVAPIEDEPAFERALHEASALIDHPSPPESFHQRRFRHLLHRIADYCDGAARGRPARAIPDDFDARLRDAVRRIAEAKHEGAHPWSPMVGGDVRIHPAEPSHG